ncbi:MAG: LCP family protein [Candidatus Saccharibacteria bacterium]
MDNFRRPQKPKFGLAVDGLLKPSKKSYNPNGVGNFRRQPSGASSAKRQSIGNFKQPDGFRVTTQPVLPEASPFKRALPKQIEVINQPQKGEKKRFRRSAAKKQAKREKRQDHKWRTLFKRTSIALMVLLMVGGGYVGAKAYWKSRHVLRGGGSAAALQANVSPSLLKGEGDGRINVLLLGKGGPGHDGPDLTDTIIIASVDPVHHDAALLSIPRDFWVKASGGYGYSKINSVYPNAKYSVQNGKKITKQNQAAETAGEDAIKNTIQDTFGIPIHYYVMVDFSAFKESIDTVGGIDLNVKTQLYDPTVAWENNRNPLIAAVGQQHMNGTKALLYSRSRHGSARGDFDRAERQREVMIALKERVFTLGTFSNPVKISQLIDAFGNHVQTNFSVGEVSRLYTIAKQISSSAVTSVDLVTPPNELLSTGDVGGQSVVLPKAGIGNYAAIQNYIRNTLKDSYIRDENAKIVVLNGTATPGLATVKANFLKSYGYNVTTSGDAPTKNYTKTQLIDLRSGTKKYTQHYLENRLNVKAVSTLPAGIDAGNADFVIILGQ